MISEVLAAAGGLSMAAAPAAFVLRRMRDQLREARQACELEHYDATHDDLTGLANRRAFYEVAASRVATANPEQSYALALIDVDAFKAINDTYGHPVGDLVLRSVAHQLDAVVPHGLVVRLGGDEYAVLVELRRGESAIDVGMALSQSSDGVDVDEQALAVTFSVGVVEVAAPTGLEEALACADTALYRAKQTGAVEVYVPLPDHQVVPQPRQPLRNRDLDVTPAPMASSLDGGR